MKIILKQKVLNQMFSDDLGFMQSLRHMNASRYLFLEFIEEFSLVLVGN
jgi:hypothetical protein